MTWMMLMKGRLESLFCSGHPTTPIHLFTDSTQLVGKTDASINEAGNGRRLI